MPGFQQVANVQPAIGVEGDWASVNPRASVLAGAGALVAGPGGATVGRFAWLTTPADPDGTPGSVITAGGSGPVAGFIHREQQALITVYLGEASMVVPAGFPVTVHNAGDWLCRNRGATAVTVGMKAFVNYSDGSAVFAAAGSAAANVAALSSGYVTKVSVANTGSIAGSLMTITTAGGAIYPGAAVTGANVLPGTTIVRQMAGGTPAGAGLYEVTPGEQVVASTTLTTRYSILTATTVASGVLAPGDTISSASLTGTPAITQQLTGTAGAAGNYATTSYQDGGSVGSALTDIVVGGGIETKWIARSAGLPGELIKVSSWPLG